MDTAYERAHDLTEHAIKSAIEELRLLKMAVEDRIRQLEDKLAGEGVTERQFRY